MNAPLDMEALSIFDEVCDMPAIDRRKTLDTRCAGRPSLRVLVERMLELDEVEEASDPLAGHGAELLAAKLELFEENVPPSIAGFRIVREIGRGGMGVVYEAQQTEPSRRVAIKVIREGIAGREVVRRFRREAELLGRLQHPGVAHVYESGFDPVGRNERPYFAMEFVDGLPLDEHADTHRLELPQRVELVARVCDAVHHAHQKGILHRDLKSANVLVVAQHVQHQTQTQDPIGQPKVLDFGIARLTEDTDAMTLYTNAGQVIGSLACMSPEQLAGDRDRVDTRTDVYAIGVMLYGLLARRPPRQLTGLSVPEALRVVTEHTPPTLSTVDPSLRGDLSVIAAKALQLDPEMRYESVAMLGEDLRRTLRNEPISAQPASRWYRFKKFTKRHRAMVSVITAAALLLVAATAVSSALATHAGRSADRERSTAERADRASYRASIAAASAAVRDGDARLARAFLADAPAPRRGWEWRHLNAQVDTSTARAPITPVDRTQDAKKFLVASCWTSPDGETVYVGTHEAKRRDFESFAAGSLARLGGWSSGPDSRVLGVNEDSTIVFLYDARTKQAESRDLITGALLNASQFDPGPRVAESYSVLGADGAEWALSFSSSTRGAFAWIGAYSPDRSLRAAFLGVEPQIVPLEPGKPTVSFGPFREVVRGASFSPDGDQIAYVTLSRDVAVFDTQTGQSRWWNAEAHDDAVMCVVHNPRGDLIATGSQDRTIRLWDANTGEALGRMIGHEYAVVGLGFDPTGETLYSVDATEIRSWRVADALDDGAILRHDWFVRLLDVSADGSRIVICSDDYSLSVYDIRGTDRPRTISLPERVRRIAEVSFVSSGHIAILADTGTDKNRRAEIMVIDPDVPRPTRFYDLSHTPMRDLIDLAGSFRGAFRLEAMLNTETVDTAMLLQSEPRTVALYDAEGRVLTEWHDIEVHNGVAAFHTASGRGYVATATGEVVALDRDSARLVGTMDAGTERIQCLAVHPDGSRLFGGSSDTTIRVWDTETLELVAVLRGHRDTVRDLTFSPDGRTLYSASDDYTVRTWTTRDG